MSAIGNGYRETIAFGEDQLMGKTLFQALCIIYSFHLIRILCGKYYFYSHVTYMRKLRHTCRNHILSKWWTQAICLQSLSQRGRHSCWSQWWSCHFCLKSPSGRFHHDPPLLLTSVNEGPTSTGLCLLGQAPASIRIDDLCKQLPLPWPPNWNPKGDSYIK